MLLKRSLLIVLVTFVYLAAVSLALVFLPLEVTPVPVKSLFAKALYADLAWAKFRHFVMVALVGGGLAALLVKLDREHAQTDAVLVGILSVLFGIFLRIHVAGGAAVGCVEITDYLTVGLAVPALVAVARWALRGPGSASAGR
jgi:hypothetical protein